MVFATSMYKYRKGFQLLFAYNNGRSNHFLFTATLSHAAHSESHVYDLVSLLEGTLEVQFYVKLTPIWCNGCFFLVHSLDSRHTHVCNTALLVRHARTNHLKHSIYIKIKKTWVHQLIEPMCVRACFARKDSFVGSATQSVYVSERFRISSINTFSGHFRKIMYNRWSKS